MITRGLIGLITLVGLSKESNDDSSLQSFTQITVRSGDWKKCDLKESSVNQAGEIMFEYDCQGNRFFIIKKRINYESNSNL